MTMGFFVWKSWTCGLTYCTRNLKQSNSTNLQPEKQPAVSDESMFATKTGATERYRSGEVEYIRFLQRIVACEITRPYLKVKYLYFFSFMLHSTHIMLGRGNLGT